MKLLQKLDNLLNDMNALKDFLSRKKFEDRRAEVKAGMQKTRQMILMSLVKGGVLSKG
jgi:hypothetical protein